MEILCKNSILILKKNWNNKKINNDNIALSILRLKSINSAVYYKRFKEFGNLLNDKTIFSFKFLQNKNICWFWNAMLCFKIYLKFFFKLHKRKYFSPPPLSRVFACVWKSKFLEYYFFIRQKYNFLSNKLYFKNLINFIKKKKKISNKYNFFINLFFKN